MTDDKNIPEFALQPAKELDEMEIDGFDPTPYDRLLSWSRQKKVSQDGGFEPMQRFHEEKNENPEVTEHERQAESSELEAVFERQPINEFFESKEVFEVQPEKESSESKEVFEVQPEKESSESKEVFEVQPEKESSESKEVFEMQPEKERSESKEVFEMQPELEKALSLQPETEEAFPIQPETEEVFAMQPELENVNVDLQDDLYKATETEEAKPISAPLSEPLAEPAMAKPVTIIPMTGTLITNELKMTDIREKPETRIFIEEDILVPDTKEDLASILSMTGNLKLFDSEIHVGQMSQDSVKVAGEIQLHTLYIPEKYSGEEQIIAIQSRLPFKTDWTLNVTPLSHLVIKSHLENVDYTVINERKFRAKLTIRLAMREYANVELQVFQGIKGETMQLLKEKIQLTHVSDRKTDTMEINEALILKDTQPKPERILKYDVDIVENHKQITEEKAVINATIYCNVLYLGRVADSEDASVTQLTPQLFQGKTEFTQFIPISNASEGSRVAFSDKGLVVRIKEENEEAEAENAFSLEGEVETSIEIYKNLEREIVTDIYHRTKDIISDKVELETMSLGGSGVTEAAVREIINIPEKYGEVKRVIYISGNIKNSKSVLEQNKNIVEGIVDITLLCIPEDEKKSAFSLNKELNFRGAMEIPEARGNTKANSEISIKELWFDRINSKQIEVNANLFISSSVYGQEKYQIIEKVCFVEPQAGAESKPGMVVYITKGGDTLWNIAKKYRTTVDMITEINELEKDQKLESSTKLLIVR